MKIAVIGTGYVGLVTGACFAEMGNDVTCVDTDADKVARLNAGEIPIYEPGLDDLVAINREEGRLAFTTEYADAIPGAEVVMIAVGTPPAEDGSADLQYVIAAAQGVGRHLDSYAVIATKSTVPVGTADIVRAEIRSRLEARGEAIEFDVVSNPEFLKEGAAIEDCMRPDRVIVGSDSDRAVSVMRELYRPFCRLRDKLILMGVRDAEMTKFAANAMLATRISFMNEIAGICERVGADVEMVRLGVGSDPRIGDQFLYPGAGFGGSCFPKDVKALIHAAKAEGFEPLVLQATEDRNSAQKSVLFEKIAAHFGALDGKTIAIWGLAFKPGTDDMREAPSTVLIERLLEGGAAVRAYDPVARLELDHPRFVQVDDQYAALEGAAALALVTEWKQFRQPDFRRMAGLLENPIIFDGRNQYEPAQLKARGFQYHGIGRRM